jgi:CRP/FNR family transcriptional regulator, cyclic AMP receptor protein
MPHSVLTTLPLFTDLAEPDVARISAALRRRQYRKGTLVHASGAMGADLYIITSGRVTIQFTSEGGEALTLRLLGPGDFFGELSLLDDEPWYGDATALDDCELLLLAKRDFLAILDTYPGVSRRLLTIVCKRLRQNASFARDLAFLDVPTRVARALVALVDSERWGWTDDRRLESERLVPITQAALAAYVGATRESINKWLGYYERQGYITRQRESVVVLQLDELRLRALVE